MGGGPKATCFVISPFKAPFREYYEKIYRPAIEAAGFQPILAAEIFRPGVFMQEVYDQMAACAVALAELTGRNPNVFYELGLAHALGKPVVLVAQRKDDFPADVSSIRWIHYEVAKVQWDKQLGKEIEQALIAVRNGPVALPFRAPGALSPAEQLAKVSGTQKSIFDYLVAQPGWIGISHLMGRFKRSQPEIYYRLEALMLRGLIERDENTMEPRFQATAEGRRASGGYAPSSSGPTGPLSAGEPPSAR